ncbi:hypothetical protein [Aquifex pyrophilus]
MQSIEKLNELREPTVNKFFEEIVNGIRELFYGIESLREGINKTNSEIFSIKENLGKLEKDVVSLQEKISWLVSLKDDVSKLNEDNKKIIEKISSIETNVAWIKRIGQGILAIIVGGIVGIVLKKSPYIPQIIDILDKLFNESPK